MRRTIVGAAVLIVLAGCANLDSGTVIDKDHDAAWTQWITHCSGKPVVCTNTPVYHPEKWSLYLRDGSTKDWKTVSEAEYNKYSVGDQYP